MPKRYKVLITGSSGMLGADLCRELRSGYDVAGLDLVRGPGLAPGRFYRADITDARSVGNAIARARPDAVIHSAAWTDVDGCELDRKKAFAVNSAGTKNVAAACRKAGSVLIYISTDFVFDGKKKGPYSESDRTGPLSVYGRSKLRGEEYVAKILKRYLIVRTSWLYGKRGKNFVDTIAARAKAGQPLRVVKDQVGSPTYTKDLAKAIHALLGIITNDDPRFTIYGIYHVSNSGKVSWFGYAKSILKISGMNTKVLPISSRELSRPARRPAMSVLDNSKFRKYTGYAMPGWKNALKRYLLN
ncbi:MAG: dTDP-4-dehydrorhamnose reductase [Candidatus Omnitrophica bacterium]|nr:dTDP-4-dehydrorhamnose reductase [Candidatus Omnitrophota bacterium]